MPVLLFLRQPKTEPTSVLCKLSAHNEIRTGGRNADFAVLRDGALPVTRLAVDVNLPVADPAFRKPGDIDGE